MSVPLKSILFVGFLAGMLISAPLLAEDSLTPTTLQETEPSMNEVNKSLTNPVSDVWSISFQQNNYILDIPGRPTNHWNSNLLFQPVLPVSLTGDWNLVTRPVFQVFNSVPFARTEAQSPPLPPRAELKRTTDFGDTIFLVALSPSPKIAGNWLLGLGPTFILPTATSLNIGQGKWQVGPGAAVGYMSEKWILAAFLQNWTSFAGQHNRNSVNQMNLQPIGEYFLPDGWSIGYSGNILADWTAVGSGNTWTVPIGASVSKMVNIGRLPVKLSLAGQ